MSSLKLPPHRPAPQSRQSIPLTTLCQERVIQSFLALAAAIPVLISVTILGIFLYEAFFFFQDVSFWQFFTDTEWTPSFSSRKVGIGVLASATLMIALIATLFAIPFGVLAAIYLHEYAPPLLRRILKPTLEALSGIPTIVYGYFALLFVTPLLQDGFARLGNLPLIGGMMPELDGFNALSAGLMTGVLIAPIISSISEDAIANVPQQLREGGYALGFTKRELIWRILLPTAFPGIIAAITLAASRALGETMIAAIAAGQNPQLTLNPFITVESMTAFIIQVSLGDVPADSFIFHAIFTVGFVLFLITLSLNWLGHWLVRRHQQIMTGMAIPTAEISATELEQPAPPPPSVSLPKLAPNRPDQHFEQSLNRRDSRDRLFVAFTFLAALLGIIMFATLLLTILQQGLPSLDWQFLTRFPSRRPEDAGIFAGLMGTLWLLGLTALFAFPIGIGAAIYLEEYLPKNYASYLLEIHLDNLAAIPSIIYGLLGLAIFARTLRFITGGASLLSAALVLTVIVLPLVIITTRAALRSVSDTQRQAGYGVGMTRWQVIYHVILPTALPRILTGMLLTLSRAIGETAPLIAIGAAAFVPVAPALSLEGLQGGFTTLTTQIFYWVSRPKVEFHNLAAATILVLGGIVLGMNILAVLLRDFYRSHQKKVL
ncbi:phosphate ABC transporter permease subunit PstC [Spirulina sp. CS-785/01]|uniref:phosphate ABC transporter permease subunit PstC n=1 Tax=Spirulina sp. CS-785/01 TaxID=3021716 RepID=UPI00232B2B67|nr:phosphate ABC transporter permease subunit PstC [Spirulina sp. CS-785/01]MDB9315753.1 phosphate ABC transporter permease subunit PstC [Spirulina sp. CS-785/01]